MAWRKFLALGLLATAAFAGCTVTTDDPGEDDGGDGGSSSGGAGSGGKASGGSSSGGKASGGSGAVDSGPATCGAGDNECSTCVQDKCCEEWLDCGNDPDCSYKSDSNPGELLCVQDCLINQLADAGAVDLGECDSACAVGSAGLATATSELIACIREKGDAGLQNCSTPCFGVEL